MNDKPRATFTNILDDDYLIISNDGHVDEIFKKIGPVSQGHSFQSKIYDSHEDNLDNTELSTLSLSIEPENDEFTDCGLINTEDYVKVVQYEAFDGFSIDFGTNYWEEAYNNFLEISEDVDILKERLEDKDNTLYSNEIGKISEKLHKTRSVVFKEDGSPRRDIVKDNEEECFMSLFHIFSEIEDDIAKIYNEDTENNAKLLVINLDFTNGREKSYGEIKEITTGNKTKNHHKTYCGDEIIYTNVLTFFDYDYSEFFTDIVVVNKTGSYISLKDLLVNRGSGYTTKQVREVHDVYKMFITNSFEMKHTETCLATDIDTVKKDGFNNVLISKSGHCEQSFAFIPII